MQDRFQEYDRADGGGDGTQARSRGPYARLERAYWRLGPDYPRAVVFAVPQLALLTVVLGVAGLALFVQMSRRRRSNPARRLQRTGAGAIGDAVMLRVPDPAGAVRLAVRILDEIGRRHGSLAVRIGAHTGPAVERDGDWFGATVNLAARVAAAAAPGEVLMTESTRAGGGSALSEFELQGRGSQAFKNVSEAVELHALVLAEQRATADLPVDPVCRMTVDPEQSRDRRAYRGRELYFCSSDCADVFDRDRERYSPHAM